ncbi:MAG: ribonuclease P protein component 4 [Candidatus Hermodarchaeota archaeon]
MPNQKNLIKKIASSRINFLFQKAYEIYPENKVLANRYVYLARKYAQRAKIKIPLKYKKQICHKCKSYLYPGINYRVRMQSRKGKGSHLSVTCLDCNKTTRYFIKTKKNKKELSN